MVYNENVDTGKCRKGHVSLEYIALKTVNIYYSNSDMCIGLYMKLNRCSSIY